MSKNSIVQNGGRPPTTAPADFLAASDDPAGTVTRPIRHRPRTRLKTLALGIYRLGLRLGIVILPHHYYVPISDINELRRTRRDWAKRSSLAGVAIDVDAQAAWLRSWVMPYQAEYAGNSHY